jgi:uncharacterized protein (DUF1697 family)
MSPRARPVAAFLRGINLGARNRVPMAELRELLAGAGYGDVRTHLQSGNVVLDASKAPSTLERELSKLIGDEFGFDVAVIVRTLDELRDVVEYAPLLPVADDGSKHFVAFCSAEPDAAGVAALLEEDWGKDRVAARGRELYAWCPDGMRNSRLMQRLGGAKLGASATVRNWNTVTKVVELAEEERG